MDDSKKSPARDFEPEGDQWIADPQLKAGVAALRAVREKFGDSVTDQAIVYAVYFAVVGA